MDLYQRAKSIRTKSIWACFIWLTIVGILVTMVLSIVVGVQILSTDWKNKELDDSKTIWGILCFIFLGPIAGWVFGSKAVNALSSSSPQANY